MLKKLPKGPLVATALLLVPLIAAAPAFLRGGAVKMLTLEGVFVLIAVTLGIVYVMREP